MFFFVLYLLNVIFLFFFLLFHHDTIQTNVVLILNQPTQQKLNKSVRTDLDGAGALSRLSITQANVRHSGIYTCSVSDTISQSLRLHIIDGEYKTLFV